MASFNPADWKREKGSSRGYIDTKTGKRLSRRQFDKLRGPVKKPKAVSAATRLKQKQYRSLLRDYVRYQEEIGKPIGKRAASMSPEMKQIVKDLKLKRGENPRDKKVNARRVAALKLTGRRRGIPDHVIIGESPK